MTRARCYRCIPCVPASSTVDDVPMCRKHAAEAIKAPKDIKIAPLKIPREVGAVAAIKALTW